MAEHFAAMPIGSTFASGFGYEHVSVFSHDHATHAAEQFLHLSPFCGQIIVFDVCECVCVCVT